MRIFKGKNTWIMLIIAPKIVILFKNRIIKIEFWQFLAQKFKYSNRKSIYKNPNKSSIFGTKNQIHNFVIFFENWFFWTEFEIFKQCAVFENCRKSVILHLLNNWSLKGQILLPERSIFKRTKIGGKCKNWKIQMRHFGWFSNNV